MIGSTDPTRLAARRLASLVLVSATLALVSACAGEGGASPRTSSSTSASPPVAGPPTGSATASPGARPSPLGTPGGAAPSDTGGGRARHLEAAIASRVDDIRAERGLPRLQPRDDLASVAADYSRRMAAEGFFRHRAPGGGTVADRVRDAGIRFRMVGENLFRVSGPVEDVAGTVVQGWMDSPGHRKNMLREGFEQTGVGVWQQGDTTWVTQILLTPREG